MYKIYVTPNGSFAEVVLEYHLNHNIEDIDPRLRVAMAMLDAALGNGDYPQTKIKGRLIETLPGVGCKWASDDAFSPPEYYISNEYLKKMKGTGE